MSPKRTPEKSFFVIVFVGILKTLTLTEKEPSCHRSITLLGTFVRYVGECALTALEKYRVCFWWFVYFSALPH